MASDRAGYHSASMDIAGGGVAGGRGGSQSGGGAVGASAAVSTSFRVGSPSSGGSADQNEVIRRWNMEVRGVPIVCSFHSFLPGSASIEPPPIVCSPATASPGQRRNDVPADLFDMLHGSAMC